MANEGDPHAGRLPGEVGIEDVRRWLRTYFNLEVDPSDRGEIADLVQECMLRLARYDYRWPAARKIDRSVHVDFVKGKQRRKQQEEIVMHHKLTPQVVIDHPGLREEADQTTRQIHHAADTDDEKKLVELALEVARFWRATDSLLD